MTFYSKSISLDFKMFGNVDKTKHKLVAGNQSWHFCPKSIPKYQFKTSVRQIVIVCWQVAQKLWSPTLNFFVHWQSAGPSFRTWEMMEICQGFCQSKKSGMQYLIYHSRTTAISDIFSVPYWKGVIIISNYENIHLSEPLKARVLFLWSSSC